ncbi:MAG TPA: methyltransferase [Planctomycetota bacterium]|nr:methyltransferase [Planctomycetota bacterium]
MSAQPDPGSFRDREARVFLAEGEVWRGLSARALEQWRALEASGLARRWIDAGRLVASELVERGPADAPPDAAGRPWAGFLRHARVETISYPYEWSFGMLRAAASHTLALLADALAQGWILKDATPYNVQFQGARPVFVDAGSFEPLPEGAAWVGYRQFCELFLYPLLLTAHWGVDFRPWLRGRLEGIPAGELRALCSWRDLLRPGVLAHVALPAALQKRFADTREDARETVRRAGFRRELIEINVRKLRALVERLEWRAGSSTWSDYAENTTYDAGERARKAEFVRRAAAARAGGVGWDLGANTGEYSRVAAEHLRTVLALDADHLAVERNFRALAAEGRGDVLPLVADVSDPSPGLGWRGRERRTLVERSRPDLVLALALVHHIAIGAHVPLPEFAAWLCGLGADLVVEFVAKDDPQTQRLLRHKDDRYDDYTLPALEAALAPTHTVVAREVLQGGSRTLLHAVRRP